MQKSIACAAAFALGALVAAPIHAEGSPSAKQAVVYSGLAVVNGTDYETILAQHLKTANAKGLGIHVSLECGLSTPTFVKSKGGRVESTASAEVRVQVLVDGQPIGDGEDHSVTFCSRSKKTTATFAGIFTKPENETCFELVNPDNGEPPSDVDDAVVRLKPDCLSEEDLELVDDSLSAHSYFFYYDDTTPGDHLIEVQAKVAGDATDGSATALLGQGSMLIEEIRLTKDAVIEMP